MVPARVPAAAMVASAFRRYLHCANQNAPILFVGIRRVTRVCPKCGFDELVEPIEFVCPRCHAHFSVQHTESPDVSIAQTITQLDTPDEVTRTRMRWVLRGFGDDAVRALADEFAIRPRASLLDRCRIGFCPCWTLAG